MVKRPVTPPAANPALPKGQSDFISAFRLKPQLLKAAKSMKDAKDPNARPDIPEGRYVCTFQSATFSAGKTGVPRIRLRFTVARGPYSGNFITKDYDLGMTRPDPKKSAEEQMEFVQNIFDRTAVELQRMGVVTDFDSPEAIIAAVQELNQLSPTVELSLAFTPNGYQKVYINRKVEDEGAPAAPPPEAEVVDEDNEDAIEGDAEDLTAAGEFFLPSTEGEAEEDQDEPPLIEVDDQVRYKPKGAKKPLVCTVILSDTEKRTCSLKNSVGGIVQNVSWDAVEGIFQ